jgi:hypothetical protein
MHYCIDISEECGIPVKIGRMRVSARPTALRCTRSMKKESLTGLQDSGTNIQLRQVLSHRQIASPANGDPQSALSHADRDSSAATSEPPSAGRANDE